MKEHLASLRLRWSPAQWEKYMKAKEWFLKSPEFKQASLPVWADTYFTETISNVNEKKPTGDTLSKSQLRRLKHQSLARRKPTKPEDIGQEKLL